MESLSVEVLSLQGVVHTSLGSLPNPPPHTGLTPPSDPDTDPNDAAPPDSLSLIRILKQECWLPSYHLDT